MLSKPPIYPFGYIFSDEVIETVPENYDYIMLLEKYYYYYDESMTTNILEKQDYFIIIHGDFVHVGINSEMSKQVLLNHLLISYEKNYDEFLDTLDFIGGRFVVIVGNRETVNIYPDATNTRSTYYTTKKNIVASHAFILQDIFKFDRVDFFSTLPSATNALLNTPFKGIKSLIPNHYFNFYSKKHKRFFPRKNNKYSELSEEKKLELLEHFLKGQLDYFFSEDTNFILSLTGGGDSRVFLALTRSYMDRIHYFTYATTDGTDNSTFTSSTLSMDYNIVKTILKDIPINHTFFFYKDDNKHLTTAEEQALIKNTIGRHSAFLIPYLRDMYPTDNLKHIRGNLMEIGETFYFKKDYQNSNIKNARKVFKNEHRTESAHNQEKTLDEMFNEYISEIQYDQNLFDYHILDMQYWELRMGRWHTEILNTHDIVCDTINPFNHRAVIDLSLSYSYPKRRSRYFQYELINRNYPVLNFYGLNNNKNLYEQFRDTILNLK
ncbi:hypothetical protein FO441_00970 [Salinicoccus cyprini]|uniref:Asparagine synthetase domain-containing protein n=1 Tax=Salinicoccus cyprini TaxID=2493691 RepID=A0A558AX95_9STAP|nr:hypothetical protein [Salinicoccus cyprini]TVT28883.1 hypothetical protein FO441_00970 [Salinicoccus cyprini]